jgi:hypothetical protein
VKKVEVASVVGGGGHDLDLGIVTVEVDEDKLGAGSADAENTASEGNSHVLKEHTLLGAKRLVLLNELINSVCTVELVRVGVAALVAELLNVLLSVVSVLSRVKVLLSINLGLGSSSSSRLGLLSLLLFLLSQFLTGLQLATIKKSI